MKTRMMLWQNYRNEIYDNAALQKAVLISNKKLHILYQRLLKVFPNYEIQYKDKTISLSNKFKHIKSFQKFKNTKIQNALIKINELEKNITTSTSLIDEITFSSKELDDVISSIKKGKIKSIDYMYVGKKSKILLQKEKIIKLKNPIIKKINIAIDGPSGSGKSSVAKFIANKFNLFYINTGLVYRSIALNCINKNIDFKNTKQIISSLSNNMIKMLKNEVIFLYDDDVTKKLRLDSVSIGASLVAQIPRVREYVVSMIQKISNKLNGVIMDGRDTTFVILPDAKLKIYLDTNPKIRAQRRMKQNKLLGFEMNYEKILFSIKERDNLDFTRVKDPLHITKDAYFIDASCLSFKQVVDKISKLVLEKMK